ncbi:hypothetical protein T492DRAFT_901028, partial [Pavlovales sp. CCMP2436]
MTIPRIGLTRSGRSGDSLSLSFPRLVEQIKSQLTHGPRTADAAQALAKVDALVADFAAKRVEPASVQQRLCQIVGKAAVRQAIGVLTTGGKPTAPPARADGTNNADSADEGAIRGIPLTRQASAETARALLAAAAAAATASASGDGSGDAAGPSDGAQGDARTGSGAGSDRFAALRPEAFRQLLVHAVRCDESGRCAHSWCVRAKRRLRQLRSLALSDSLALTSEPTAPDADALLAVPGDAAAATAEGAAALAGLAHSPVRFESAAAGPGAPEREVLCALWKCLAALRTDGAHLQGSSELLPALVGASGVLAATGPAADATAEAAAAMSTLAGVSAGGFAVKPEPGVSQPPGGPSGAGGAGGALPQPGAEQRQLLMHASACLDEVCKLPNCGTTRRKIAVLRAHAHDCSTEGCAACRLREALGPLLIPPEARPQPSNTPGLPPGLFAVVPGAHGPGAHGLPGILPAFGENLGGGGGLGMAGV